MSLPTTTRKTLPPGEGFRPSQRLRRSADYLRCYRRGRKHHGRLATLHVHRNDLEEPRLGITASRKVGKAVVRHRLKRRVRELFRRYEHRSSLPRTDIVVHLKPPAGVSSFDELRHELHRLLGRLMDRRNLPKKSSASSVEPSSRPSTRHGASSSSQDGMGR